MIAKAVSTAVSYAPSFAAWTAEHRRDVLHALASALSERGEEVIALAEEETGLTNARLSGELDRTTGQLRLLGDYVAVVDVEGYVHLMNRDNGAFVGRIATDGSAATAQPAAVGANAVWQSVNGTLYSVGAR